MVFSLPRKTTSEFFSPLQEQGFYAAKTKSCCIKHTLLFAPTQINPSPKAVLYLLKMNVFKAMKYRLIACCKVTTSCPQSIRRDEATSIQIEATSTHQRKSRRIQHHRAIYLHRRICQCGYVSSITSRFDERYKRGGISKNTSLILSLERGNV